VQAICGSQQLRKCFAVLNDCCFFGKGGTRIKIVTTYCILFFVHFGYFFLGQLIDSGGVVVTTHANLPALLARKFGLDFSNTGCDVLSIVSVFFPI
jgi:hypothetical protein